MARTKKLRLPLFRTALALGLASSVSATWAAELDPQAIERGKTASQTCVACHQADGSGLAVPGAEPWPRIAGMDRDYMYAQLLAVKEGTRQSVTMTPFVNMLTEEQLKDVATYYASLPAPKITFPEVDEELLKHGEKLATKGDWDRYIVACASCHGVGSQGNGSVFPALAGQHPAYITQQIGAWKKGTRKNDPQNLMGAIAERLNDRDIEAVSAWLARQPVAAAQ